MKTILITGSKGQLGQEMKQLSNKFNNIKYYFTDIDELDITNLQELRYFVKNKNIDYIVNCAAYTAVDNAEKEINSAKKINILGVKNLGIISAENNISIIHISTDYVYDGKSFRPYKENAPVNPQSVYGSTKLEGEKQLTTVPLPSLFADANTRRTTVLSKYIIIRTSWLYSSFGNNFVKTMLSLAKERPRLKVVFDQIGTPTYAADLASTILQIIEMPLSLFKTGIYHYSNEGVCSWYDFAKEIMRQANLKCKILPVESKEFPTPAKRPNYSVLNKEKIKKTFNISIPYWSESLAVMLANL